MFIIPLYVILFIYIAFFAVFVIFSLINFYHIVMSDSFTFVSFSISFFVFALTILTLYFTWSLLADINWRDPLISLGSELLPPAFR